MQTVYDELTRDGQARYNGIRRKVQFFTTFAGGVVEALRESGFRLSSFEKQAAFTDVFGHGGRAPGQPSHRRAGNNNIQLFFEQADRDQCTVLIVPYRTDLPFLSKGRFVAQLGLELSRYCNDPDTLRQAMSVNAKAAFGSFLGGSRLPKLYLDSPPDLKPPGTMTFELRGARLVVAMNVLANLGKYRMSDFDLDIDAIRGDLQAYFYGLEKYLALLVQNFGGKASMQGHDAPLPGEQPAPPPPPPLAGAPLPPMAPPAGGTVPLRGGTVPVGGTVPLHPSSLPPQS